MGRGRQRRAFRLIDRGWASSARGRRTPEHGGGRPYSGVGDGAAGQRVDAGLLGSGVQATLDGGPRLPFPQTHLARSLHQRGLYGAAVQAAARDELAQGEGGLVEPVVALPLGGRRQRLQL